VPADGFASGKKSEWAKVPHNIFLRDNEPFAFASLWESWRDGSVPDAPTIRTCTIITTAANAFVSPIHHRMPVILPRDAYGTWLAAQTSPDQLHALLVPYAGEMAAHPVSPRVNTPRHHDSSLLESVAMSPAIV
jgi:putative SOS response-associated peptidase YedK